MEGLLINHMDYRSDDGLSIQGPPVKYSGTKPESDVPPGLPGWDFPASNDTGLERLLRRSMVADAARHREVSVMTTHDSVP